MTDERVKFRDLGETSLRAEIEIKAAPERVYAAWTQPEALRKWFGPRVGNLRVDRFDPSPEGGYDVTMEFSDGDRVRITGEYREVDPPRRLVFTWRSTDGPAGPDESLVTVDLTPSAAGTHLTLTHERFATAEARDRHQEGWGPLLVRLASALEE